MRIAFLITPTYENRPDIAKHPASKRDNHAVRERLTQPGYDFNVFDLPPGQDPDVWLKSSLESTPLGLEDPVLLYVSAIGHLDEAGEVFIELDAPVERDLRRLSLAKLRAVISSHHVRSAAVILDFIYEGKTNSVLAAEYVAASRRVFAPELSGYSMACAARSREQAQSQDLSPFTFVWLAAMANRDALNKVGVAFVSRIMEVMREDVDLYTNVPCFSLVPGRRDLKLYSSTSPSLHRPSTSGLARVSTVPASLRPVERVDDVFAQSDALIEAGDLEGAVEAYKRALLMLDEKSPQRATAYIRLADIRALENRFREAALNYRKALMVAPKHQEALEKLAKVLRSEGEFEEATQVRRRLLEVLKDDDGRFEQLLLLAEDHEQTRDLSSTIEALEEARSIRDNDAKVLARLAQVYDAASQFDKVVDIKVAIAQFKTQPEEVARSLVLAADFAAKQAEDMERALLIFEDALERDPLTPRAFDAVAAHWLDQGELKMFERVLLAQTVRLDKVGAHAAEAEIWREVASLRKTKFDDLHGAIEALDRCVERVPTDVEARVALAELLVEADELEAAIMSLEIAAWHAPGRADTYRLMHRLLVKAGRVDQAYACAAALMLLGEAELDEELFYEQYHVGVRASPNRSMEASTWDRLYPVHRDPHVSAILDVIAPCAIEYKLSWLENNRMLPELDPETRQDPETSTVSLTRTFVWASTVLDVPLPEIYVGEDVPGGIAAVPSRIPTAVVGKSVLSGRNLKELGFLVGRDITYFRPAHYILILYSSLKEFTALFLAAVCVVRPKRAVPEISKKEINEIIKFLRSSLSEEEKSRLEEAVDEFEKDGIRADLVGWARAVEVTATRVGLLLCGDLAVVNDLLVQDDRTVGGMSAQDRIHDLLPFSVSETYAQLRREFGIGVG